jgi:hypothetical protein
VFNPSPHRRSDVVRFRIDPEPAIRPDAENLQRTAIHPLLRATFPRSAQGHKVGFNVDGEAARVIPAEEGGRYRLIEAFPALDVEWVARDVPAFGWRRVRLEHAAPQPETLDDGCEIAAGDVRVVVNKDGTLDVGLGGASFRGLVALEDTGDRGDTYDYDPVGGGAPVGLEHVTVERARHASGIERLRVARRLRVPAGLEPDRERRSSQTVALDLVCEARVAPGVGRVDLRIELDNRASDHRLRLLFPTGAAVDRCTAASTFDAMERTPGPRDAHGWIHPPPATFPHQGWVSAGGLCVVAPGLCEGEVTREGTIALTLLRAVGWLSRLRLETRPRAAGPSIPTPGAQCPGRLEARLSLLAGEDPGAARDCELGLRAVVAGDTPLAAPGQALLRLAPRELVLSAFKPAERGGGSIVRVLNPGDRPLEAHLRTGFDFDHAAAVRLDETGAPDAVAHSGREVRFEVPPRSLRSIALR